VPRTLIALVALVLLASGSSGCLMVRAEVGVGLGLGADVRIPGLAHVGAGAGEFKTAGWRYDLGYGTRREVHGAAVLWHFEGRRGVLTSDEDRALREGRLDADAEAALRRRLRPSHACFGLLPPLTSHGRDRTGRLVDPWSLEVGLMLVFFDVRLGFNPLGVIP